MPDYVNRFQVVEQVLTVPDGLYLSRYNISISFESGFFKQTCSLSFDGVLNPQQFSSVLRCWAANIDLETS